jgi:hypothetical protein
VHRGRFALALSAVTTFASTARGEDACLQAYDSSQRFRKKGELLSARQELLVCAQESCPAPVAKECTQWLREVGAALPSVVFAARDSRGNDLTDVKVLDGERVVAERLDGRELTLDPGPHVFRFEFSGKRTLTRRVLIRQAEKNRLIEVVEPPLPAAPPPEEERPPTRSPAAGPPVLPIVLGAVGVLALGSFVYFGLEAKSDVDDLDRCKPSCERSAVDSAYRKAVIADISLAVGVVSLGAGGWLWLSHSRAPNSSVRSPTGLSILGRF